MKVVLYCVLTARQNKGKNYTGHGAEEFSAVLSEMQTGERYKR